MKEQPSTSYSPDRQFELSVRDLRFGENGPYSLRCGGTEIVGLTGVSGIGKTRFLRALADLEPYQGQVFFNERSCSEQRAPEWRRRVALIPAESHWWYVRVGMHMGNAYDATETLQLLHNLGFEGDVMEWQVSRLSSGEKQRLSLARVLTRTPEALLLDELGSSLDHNNCLLLEGVVVQYQKVHSAPVLWVSHDKEQVQRLCHRVVIMKKDRLEEGSLE